MKVVPGPLDGGIDAIDGAVSAADGGLQRDAAAPEASACPGFAAARMFDTLGNSDPSLWQKVESSDHQFASPRHVVLDNDVARVTYEYLNEQMQAAHSVYLKEGEQMVRLTGAAYGDYTYWGTTVATPADSVEITEFGPDLISATFRIFHVIDNVRYTNLAITIEKTVAIHRCFPGMFVYFHTDPENIQGEKELGFGTATRVAASGTVLAVHPIAGGHVNMGISEASTPYVVTGLDSEDTLARYLILNRPLEVNSYQFSPGQWGLVTIHFIDEQMLVPEKFQAFVGGTNIGFNKALFEFESFAGNPVAVADVDASAGAMVEVAAADELSEQFVTQQAGVYKLWLRARCELGPCALDVHVGEHMLAAVIEQSDGYASHLVGEAYLQAGSNTVSVQGNSGSSQLDALVFMPSSGNPVFPAEIAAGVGPVLSGSSL